MPETLVHGALLAEIETLIAAPLEGDGRPSVEYAEHTLTAGYARALALEAERWRLERRLTGLAQRMAEEHDPSARDELSSLAGRVTETAAELRFLRGLLASLRERVRALKTA